MRRPRERPIIMSQWSIQHILHEAKTQTRRVIKPQPPEHTTYLAAEDLDGRGWLCVSEYGDGEFPSDVEPWRKCPYGQPGDVLWVKETIDRMHIGAGKRDYAAYRADGSLTPLDTWCWQRDYLASIHMPYGLSRIWLRVEDVRAERVQDISEEDAIVEGCIPQPDDCELCQLAICSRHQPPVGQFAALWNDINADSDYAWDTNCWCWAITFSVLSTTGKPTKLEATTP